MSQAPPPTPRREPLRSIFTIPSSDAAFAEHVRNVQAREPGMTPADLERRLRTLFPRVVVRERSLSGEEPSWYVYRDGAWRPQGTGPWWLQEGLPRVSVSEDGWIVDASRTAVDLLGISATELPHRHFTDFVVAGALEDSLALFDVVRQGRDLDATVLLRPTSGDVLAVEIHVTHDSGHIQAAFRLADDVDIPADAGRAAQPPRLTFKPATDVAFRGYAERAVARMPEPSPAGLELRLHRIYPHAQVVASEDTWEVRRDRDLERAGQSGWWLEPGVARVRFDSKALILEANEAASSLFGRELVGHHWQEFVTPGSTEQVSVVLEILAEVGAAESRFRIPRPDGSLLEFDSYTEVKGDEFITSMRPAAAP